MENQGTITVRKHGISSGDFHWRTNGIGTINICLSHYDYDSELRATVRIFDESPGNENTAWGKHVFEGTIAELIAQLYKANAVDILKAGELAKPSSEAQNVG